jgi:hypothetical protein
MEYYVLRYMNSVILSEMRKNFLSSGRSILLYYYFTRATKLNVNAIQACPYRLHYEMHPSFFSQD